MKNFKQFVNGLGINESILGKKKRYFEDVFAERAEHYKKVDTEKSLELSQPIGVMYEDNLDDAEMKVSISRKSYRMGGGEVVDKNATISISPERRQRDIVIDYYNDEVSIFKPSNYTITGDSLDKVLYAIRKVFAHLGADAKLYNLIERIEDILSNPEESQKIL